jgi:tight adherence protein B
MVFVAVALGTVSFAFLLELFAERRRQRAALLQLRKYVDAPTAGDSGLVRSQIHNPEWLTLLEARMPKLADLSLMLRQGGLTWTLSTFLLLVVGMGAGLGLAVLLFTGAFFPALIGTALGAWLPFFYASRKRNKRLSAFEEGLPEAIDLLSRAIRAGHPLSSGLKMVAEETGQPIAGEFLQTFEENRFGVAFDDAIVGMADRVDIIDVRILVTAILIQRQVGGNLAEVLDNLAAVIRARFTIRRQLRVYTAQGRITGWILGLLPIALAFVIYTINPEYMSILWTDPLGKFMLGTAIVMQFIGYMWIRKIVNIEI